jgi:hypothetical protein
MKQFVHIMRIVFGLAVVGISLSSIPVQAAGPQVSFVANGIGANVTLLDLSNPADPVFLDVFLSPAQGGNAASPAPKFFLDYDIGDIDGTFFDAGFGPIPSSTVNISGGSITAGKTVVQLNVNTCDVAGFTTFSGPCGSFNITWTEAQATAGSDSFRGTQIITFFGGGKETSTGTFLNFASLATGTALGFGSSFPGSGLIIQFSGVGITFTSP